MITRPVQEVETLVARRIWAGPSKREYLTDIECREIQTIGGADICPACLSHSNAEYDMYKAYKSKKQFNGEKT